MYYLYLLVFTIFFTNVGCSLDAELTRLGSSAIMPLVPGAPSVGVIAPGSTSFNVRSNVPDGRASAKQMYRDQSGNFLFVSELDNTFLKKMDSAGAAVDFANGEAQYESGFRISRAAFDSARQRILQVGYTHDAINTYFSIEALKTDGSRDPDFNSGEIVSVIQPTDFVLKWVGVDLTGAVYLVGDQSNDISIIKFLDDGRLDVNFGSSGYTQKDLGAIESTYSCDFTTDSNLVCVGVSGSGFFVIMLDTDGSFQTSFSGDGIIRDGFNGNFNDQMHLVAVERATGSNRIYALGGDTLGRKMIAYSSAGVKVPNFANDPYGHLDLFGVLNYADSIQLTGDGLVVIVGGRLVGGVVQLCVVKTRADGLFDLSFGTNGAVVLPSYTRENSFYGKNASGTVVDSSENIYLYGNSFVGSIATLYATKLQFDGTVDLSFGTAGVIRPEVMISSQEVVFGSLRDGSDNFIFGNMFNQNALFLSKHAGSGLDTSFGVQGHFTYYVDSDESIEFVSVVAAKDGGFYLAAAIYDSDSGDTTSRILKVTASGILDTSFAGGMVNLPVTLNTSPLRLAVDDSGNVYSFRQLWDGPNLDDLLINKIKSDGSADSGFGTVGQVIINQHVWPLDVEFKQGKFVLTGNAYITIKDIAVLRLLPSGSLDSSFGSSGISSIPISSENEFSSLHFDADGNITVFGSPGHNEEAVIAKFDSEGVVNSSWGASGLLLFTGASSEIRFSAMTVDDQSRLWLVGNESGAQGLIVRLNAAGTLDAAFASGGYLNDIEFLTFKTVSIEDDGFLTIVGEARPDNLHIDPILVRYNQDGTR